jgi:hypothetical protein
MKSLTCFLTGVLILLFFSRGISQPEIGLAVGLNNSKLVGDGPPGGSYKYNRGFIGFVNVDFRLSDYVKLSIQPGIRTGGATVAFRDPVLEEYRDSLKIHVLNLCLPLFLKITSFNERVYFMGGFSADFPSRIVADNGVEKIDISNELSKLNVTAQFGLGYRIPILRTVLNIELRYLQGLVNLSDHREDEEAYLPRVKSSAMQLIVGWQFPIGKNK